MGRCEASVQMQGVMDMTVLVDSFGTRYPAERMQIQSI